MRKKTPKKNKEYYQARLMLLVEEGPRDSEWAEIMRQNEMRGMVKQLKRHGVAVDPEQLKTLGIE